MIISLLTYLLTSTAVSLRRDKSILFSIVKKLGLIYFVSIIFYSWNLWYPLISSYANFIFPYVNTFLIKYISPYLIVVYSYILPVSLAVTIILLMILFIIASASRFNYGFLFGKTITEYIITFFHMSMITLFLLIYKGFIITYIVLLPLELGPEGTKIYCKALDYILYFITSKLIDILFDVVFNFSFWYVILLFFIILKLCSTYLLFWIEWPYLIPIMAPLFSLIIYRTKKYWFNEEWCGVELTIVCLISFLISFSLIILICKFNFSLLGFILAPAIDYFSSFSFDSISSLSITGGNNFWNTVNNVSSWGENSAGNSPSGPGNSGGNLTHIYGQEINTTDNDGGISKNEKQLKYNLEKLKLETPKAYDAIEISNKQLEMMGFIVNQDAINNITRFRILNDEDTRLMVNMDIAFFNGIYYKANLCEHDLSCATIRIEDAIKNLSKSQNIYKNLYILNLNRCLDFCNYHKSNIEILKDKTLNLRILFPSSRFYGYQAFHHPTPNYNQDYHPVTQAIIEGGLTSRFHTVSLPTNQPSTEGQNAFPVGETSPNRFNIYYPFKFFSAPHCYLLHPYPELAAQGIPPYDVSPINGYPELAAQGIKPYCDYPAGKINVQKPWEPKYVSQSEQDRIFRDLFIPRDKTPIVQDSPSISEQDSFSFSISEQFSPSISEQNSPSISEQNSPSISEQVREMVNTRKRSFSDIAEGEAGPSKRRR